MTDTEINELLYMKSQEIVIVTKVMKELEERIGDNRAKQDLFQQYLSDMTFSEFRDSAQKSYWGATYAVAHLCEAFITRPLERRFPRLKGKASLALVGILKKISLEPVAFPKLLDGIVSVQGTADENIEGIYSCITSQVISQLVCYDLAFITSEDSSVTELHIDSYGMRLLCHLSQYLVVKQHTQEKIDELRKSL